MPTIEGGCLCGAVRYRSDAEPVMQVVCHCETCRKNSGSAFSMNVAVPQDRLRIESGSPRRYEDHSGASGEAFYRFFCGDCGSHIYSHGPAYGAIAFIKAGTLDDPSCLGGSDASENYWGCPKGPGEGKCSTTSGPNILSTPWLSQPVNDDDDHDQH